MPMHVKRIELIVTNACTGRCKHCSNGDPAGLTRGHVQYDRLCGKIAALARSHSVQSLMCFGGEPLLFPDDTLAIYQEAAEAGIPRLQLITNGCFSNDDAVVAAVADRVAHSPVNDVLVSIDAFHQETLPLSRVRVFLEHAKKNGTCVRIHPAWLVSPAADNVYNQRTKEIIASLSDLALEENGGNVIFAAGRAITELSQYLAPVVFDPAFRCGDAPYTDPLDKCDTLSIEPDGSVAVCGFVIGNAYEQDLTEIADAFDPQSDPAMRAILTGGIEGLISYAAGRGVPCPDTACLTACGVCRALVKALRAKT